MDRVGMAFSGGALPSHGRSLRAGQKAACPAPCSSSPGVGSLGRLPWWAQPPPAEVKVPPRSLLMCACVRASSLAGPEGGCEQPAGKGS